MDESSLARYLDKDRIQLLDTISSKKMVFELLAEVLSDDLDNVQANSVYTELIARERLGSTGLGEGVAIPHCRIDAIEEIRCAVLKLNEAVEFEAPDGQAVSIIFALLVPTEANDEHLQTLASLAEFLSKPKNREALRACETSEEILEIFSTSSDKDAA